MKHLAPYWTGNIYGTNTGNLFLELSCPNQNEDVSGTLRIHDNLSGIAVYEISGTYKDSVLKITGTPTNCQHAQSAIGTLDANATINKEGKLEGTWETSIGTAGLFQAFPGTLSSKGNFSGTLTSQQIHTKSITLGAIRLFSNDIKKLFEEIKKDFTVGKVIVTYNSHDHETMEFAEKFLHDKNHSEELHSLKVFISEPSEGNINKMTSIHLGVFNKNEIRVEGPQESWVIGKAEKLASFLKPFQSSLITNYKKFGLSLNTLIFIAMIILTPGINTLRNRAYFVAMVFALLLILQQLHKRLFPIATIAITEKTAGWFSRSWPAILSWTAGIAASLIVAFVTHYFHFFGGS